MRVSEYLKAFNNRERKEVVSFQNNFWYLVVKLERFMGVWPHQSRFKNYLMRMTFLLMMISGLIPLVIRFRKEWGVNLGIATETFSGVLAIIGILIKFILSLVNNRKRQKLYEMANSHFTTITDEEEAYVLRKSAEYLMIFCIKYAVAYFTAEVIFFLLPIARMVLNYLVNGELEKTLPYYADYGFIDEDKYYVPIMIQIISMASFFVMGNCTHDFGFIMNVRHVCALFKIVEIRLREASGFLEKFEWDMLDFASANKKAYEVITTAIDLHNEALEMVSLIDKAYKNCWLIILTSNAFVFSGGAYLVLLNLDQPFNLLRYFTFFIALVIHFGAIFAHGQMIINSSSSVFDACYNVKWNLASPKTRRLLSIMMSRSFKPCELTGGGLFAISMETKCKMMKGGFSYLSVFTQK